MYNKGSHLLLITAAVLIISFGCVPQYTSGLAQEENLPEGVLFSDDFSDPPSGWGVWNRDGAFVDYYAGGLRIQVNQEYFDFWSVAGKNFRDVQIEVDAVKFSGPDDNDFGILCRYQDKENFYMFVISSDGYYGIARLEDGLYSMISADQLQYSEAIVKGQAVNRLRAVCAGDRLSLSVNGQKLAEVRDTTFASGDVGLVAGAYEMKGVEILFDNFVVETPGE